jgi:drug/metabolite transporter (DMT)-like permease
MSVLLSKGRALAPVLIVILGLLGLWLGSHSQFWLGIIAFLAAFAGVVVMSNFDLRSTEQERKSGWQSIREHGKLRYVGGQVLRGWPVLLFLLAIDLWSSYQSGKPWDPRWLATFFALLVGGSVLISLCWWYWQERKYGSMS